ncbi:hypothetical protein ABZ942_01175 [Nocardia sp. NPDC046473]|uniref:hypothetical protein n=1 Tax=Nocardia sp. NPDC046473 TaxID=3155733 RepID=UPI0033F32D0C
MKIMLGTAAAAGLTASLIFTGIAGAETPQAGGFTSVSQPPSGGAGGGAGGAGQVNPQGGSGQGKVDTPNGGAGGAGQVNPQGGSGQGKVDTPNGGAGGAGQVNPQGGGAQGGAKTPAMPDLSQVPGVGGLVPKGLLPGGTPGAPGATPGAPGAAPGAPGTAPSAPAGTAPALPNLGNLFGFGG